jgi:hypothetical protein
MTHGAQAATINYLTVSTYYNMYDSCWYCVLLPCAVTLDI